MSAIPISTDRPALRWPDVQGIMPLTEALEADLKAGHRVRVSDLGTSGDIRHIIAVLVEHNEAVIVTDKDNVRWLEKPLPQPLHYITQQYNEGYAFAPEKAKSLARQAFTIAAATGIGLALTRDMTGAALGAVAGLAAMGLLRGLTGVLEAGDHYAASMAGDAHASDFPVATNFPLSANTLIALPYSMAYATFHQNISAYSQTIAAACIGVLGVMWLRNTAPQLAGMIKHGLDHLNKPKV